jgi:hypothetical protein
VPLLLLYVLTASNEEGMKDKSAAKRCSGVGGMAPGNGEGLDFFITCSRPKATTEIGWVRLQDSDNVSVSAEAIEYMAHHL